eukprot:SAG11_NODE_12319_length_709_cov_0.934426_1_plen_70_part_01
MSSAADRMEQLEQRFALLRSSAENEALQVCICRTHTHTAAGPKISQLSMITCGRATVTSGKALEARGGTR